jgi:hypothetical protein
MTVGSASRNGAARYPFARAGSGRTSGRKRIERKSVAGDVSRCWRAS